MRAAIFIDGGYLLKQLQDAKVNPDYTRLAEFLLKPLRRNTQLDLMRCYFYYCPPWMSEKPTETELRRMAAHDRFVAEIQEGCDRWQVRLGKLERRREGDKEVFAQKRVDVQLSVDLVQHTAAGHIQHAVLVAGDSDFIPAIVAAKESGTTLTLWCDRDRSVHRDLLKLADEVHYIRWKDFPSRPFPEAREGQRSDGRQDGRGDGRSERPDREREGVHDREPRPSREARVEREPRVDQEPVADQEARTDQEPRALNQPRPDRAGREDQEASTDQDPRAHNQPRPGRGPRADQNPRMNNQPRPDLRPRVDQVRGDREARPDRERQREPGESRPGLEPHQDLPVEVATVLRREAEAPEEVVAVQVEGDGAKKKSRRRRGSGKGAAAAKAAAETAVAASEDSPAAATVAPTALRSEAYSAPVAHQIPDKAPAAKRTRQPRNASKKLPAVEPVLAAVTTPASIASHEEDGDDVGNRIDEAGAAPVKSGRRRRGGRGRRRKGPNGGSGSSEPS